MVIFAIVLSLGCTPKEGPLNPTPGGGGGSTTVAVTGVTLSQTSATLEICGTVTLTATVAPSNATDKTVTGTLPSSFSNLKKLKELTLVRTSMTSLPDIFNGMYLEKVLITYNSQMAGSLPESLGTISSLKSLCIGDNNFTGTVPDSWANLGSKLWLRGELGLDTRVPDSFVSSPYASYLINMYLTLTETADSPALVQVGDYDIPAFWPDHDLKDLVTGNTIPYKQIIAKNKVTVLLNWATWCPFSKELMPALDIRRPSVPTWALPAMRTRSTSTPSRFRASRTRRI